MGWMRSVGSGERLLVTFRFRVSGFLSAAKSLANELLDMQMRLGLWYQWVAETTPQLAPLDRILVEKYKSLLIIKGYFSDSASTGH